MTKCAIIGGGLAGLTSAVYLSGAGVNVKLFEASPKLGGRTYSFLDENSGNIIDNGQHIMMGCYYNTLELLRIIGSIDNLHLQKNLDIKFVDKEKGIISLKAYSGVYPFNLLIGLLKFTAIPLTDRIKIIKTVSKLFLIDPVKFENYSVLEWLNLEKQSVTSMRCFWEILVVGALNSKLEKASAKLFIDILKQIFLGGNKAAGIIIPNAGLSEVFSEKAQQYIRENKGEIYLSKPVKSIRVEDKKVTEIIFENGSESDFDFVISSVPHHSLSKIINPDLEAVKNFNPEYSPILSAHLWVKNNPLKEMFYGFFNSPVQWIFNHKDYITIVISSADELINLDKDVITELIICELEKNFPEFNKSLITDSKIIKEKRATFIPNIQTLYTRPDVKTEISNLFLAGDWTNTGLPATIEGAVKSGKIAGEMVIAVI